MQITITGPRKGGNTTLASEIVAHLQSLGQYVEIIGTKEEIEQVEKGAQQKNELLQSAKSSVVVGVEREDEEGVTIRDNNKRVKSTDEARREQEEGRP